MIKTSINLIDITDLSLYYHLNENSIESKSYMYSDILFFNNINTLFTMKILKFFIILFGLITLICNNTNAQAPNERAPDMVSAHPPEPRNISNIELEEPSVSMELNFPHGGASAIPGAIARMVSTEAHLTATTPTVLALRIYDSSGIEETTYTSPSITDSHTFSFIIDGDPNDELYIECGYIWWDNTYRADSGCTVIIQP